MSTFQDVVIRLAATRSSESRARDVRAYDALVYASQPQGALGTPGPDVLSDVELIADLPLVGIESVSVKWDRYQQYLAEFLDGEKAYEHISSRLSETLSPGLRQLLDHLMSGAAGPTRVWWRVEAPELEDMPWELMADGRRKAWNSHCLFVRGLPPTYAPPPPVAEGHLRLAVITGAREAPPDLLDALRSSAGIEVVPLVGDPRDALRTAVREGFELVHLVADGFVSSAYEGLLCLPDRNGANREISPSEFAAQVEGSRVTFVGLTDSDDACNEATIRGHRVPAVYRAFACFAAARWTLPTVVAPLGPRSRQETARFWSAFYTGLAQTFGLQRALTHGRSGRRMLPIAVFLRQRSSRMFFRPESRPTDEQAPRALAASLAQSESLAGDLVAVSRRFGELPETVSRFLERERARQETLKKKLDPWRSVEEDEE